MLLIKPNNQLLASVYYKSYTFFVSSSNNYIVSINNQYQCFSTTDKNKKQNWLGQDFITHVTINQLDVGLLLWTVWTSKAQGNEQIPPTSVKGSSHQGIKQCELFTMRLCQSDGHSFFWQANLTCKNEFTINTHSHTHVRESNNDIPSATHIQAIATDNQVFGT